MKLNCNQHWGDVTLDKLFVLAMRSYFVIFVFFLISPVCAGDTFLLHPRTFQVGHQPTAIAATDLNGDGWPEIITADRGAMSDPREERPANDELSLLIAKGDLEYLKLHPSLKTGFGPYAVLTANIDALKWPDIVIINFHASRNRDVSLFLNLNEEGIFKPQHFSVLDDDLPYLRHVDGDDTPIFTKPGLTAGGIADFDGDGLRDLVATGWSSDVVAYFPGEAETYFGVPTLLPASGAPADVALSDFDRDGNMDLAIALYSTGSVALWRGDGRGQFTEASRFQTRGRLPTRVASGDLNGDSLLDLVVSHSSTDDSVVLFYGDGGFQFSVSEEVLLGEEREKLEYEIRDLVVADFTGDGLADIAVACFASSEVVLLVNESAQQGGVGGFKRESYSFEEGRPRALCSSDFNGDGRLGLGVALWEPDAVGLLLSGE